MYIIMLIHLAQILHTPVHWSFGPYGWTAWLQPHNAVIGTGYVRGHLANYAQVWHHGQVRCVSWLKEWRTLAQGARS